MCRKPEKKGESLGLTPDQYRALLTDLNLSQRAAARVIGIDERTSRKYAKNGVPERSLPFVKSKLDAYKARMTEQSEEKPE